MDHVSGLSLTPSSVDRQDRDLAEIDVAIRLVEAGIATRVRLVRLVAPDALTAIAVARSRAKGLGLDVDRRADGTTALTVGPRERAVG